MRAVVDVPSWAKRLSIAVVLLCFLLSLLAWADAGNSVGPLQVIDLLQGTLTASIPLVLGALAGLLGERSGVINIAIEGQLLTGAFVAAAVASVTGGVWLGLIGGSLAGGLVGALLAIFAIMFLVDQIIVGVVLNVIALGLTNYLYDRVMVPYAEHVQRRQHVQHDQDPGARQHTDHRPDLLRREHLPVHHVRADPRDPDRPVPHPVGAAGAGGRRAPGRGRHGRHQGAVDQVPQRHPRRPGRRASAAPT